MSHKDYVEWKNSDGIEYYVEYLGIGEIHLEVGPGSMYRYSALRGPRHSKRWIHGEWCKTRKEAKQSYKEALKKRWAEWKDDLKRLKKA